MDYAYESIVQNFFIVNLPLCIIFSLTCVEFYLIYVIKAPMNEIVDKMLKNHQLTILSDVILCKYGLYIFVHFCPVPSN